jgi:LPS O-antigen subunit length determinant protein (WzzB/FepE family)
MQVELKQELYRQCLGYVEQRIQAAKQAIGEIQQSAHSETKSSAGDKYETGREMLRQETDRHTAQLNEANKLKNSLNKINPNVVTYTVGVGSLVKTDNGNFYISIGAGVLKVKNDVFFAVSPVSPIGSLLKGKKVGNKFKLNDRTYQINEVV